MNPKWLFDNYCSGCGKHIPTPAKNRSKDVSAVYCNRVCETVAKRKGQSFSKRVNYSIKLPERKQIVFPKSEADDMVDKFGSIGEEV